MCFRVLLYKETIGNVVVGIYVAPTSHVGEGGTFLDMFVISIIIYNCSFGCSYS